MKHSIIDDILYINGQSTNVVCSEAEEEFWARIKELESQVNHWKSNHDNQKTLKNQLMDRPDLKDRAASIQRLQEYIKDLENTDEIQSTAIAKYQEKLEELEDILNHTKRHNDYLIMENEELRKDWEEAIRNKD